MQNLKWSPMVLSVHFVLLIWRQEQYELAVGCIVNLYAPDIFQHSINT